MKLDEKVKISKKIIESYGWQPVNQIIWYTGGKDSAVLHHLITEQCGYKMKSAFINTGFKFKETIDLVQTVPGLHIIPPLENCDINLENGREKCCHVRKTLPMLNFHDQEDIKIAYYGIRWDETPARENDPYVVMKNRVQRVYPILHWTEEDIWAYIKQHNIKVNPLYAKGYRSLGCECCTSLPKEGGNERSGRCQDKEGVMSNLRALGYMSIVGLMLLCSGCGINKAAIMPDKLKVELDSDPYAKGGANHHIKQWETALEWNLDFLNK